jgi:glycosyltransferase involved in cell wall biosynthesis
VGIAIPDLPERAARPEHRPLSLIVVGTVDRHKRQDLAVDALAALHASGVDAELTLVGAEADPRYALEVRTAAAEAGIAQRVKFAGLSDDVASHLCRADVMLLPAGEVTPLVLMEAMALGTPVVAARMGSIPDVVVDGSGLLVEPDDAEAFAAAARRIAESPELAASLAAEGRRHVSTTFDERHSHARLLEHVERLPRRR